MSNKFKKVICYLLFLVCSFAVPLIAIFYKYQLFDLFFQASFKTKIIIMLSISVICLGLYFRQDINKFLDSLPMSLFKCVFNGIKDWLILIAILYIAINIIIKGSPADLSYIASWVIGSNAISMFIFEPMWKHYEKLDARDSVNENI